MIKMLLLLIIVSLEVVASYDAGRVAYDRGDYTLAYEIWMETAKEQSGALNDSFQWTRSSYEQQRNAQYAIALLYWQGKGVDQDYAQAAKWLKLAIKSGHIKAQLKMGFLYLQGKGVEKNEVEARKKFLIAAEHGFVDAQFNIGLMYLIGIGGERSASKAKYWLKEAALQGDGPAFEELMKFKEYSHDEIHSENAEGLAFEEQFKFWTRNRKKLLVEKNDNSRVVETIPVKHGAIKRDQVDVSESDDAQQTFVLHKPTWLLKQTGKKYALQVLAMRSLQELKNFTDGLSVDGDWVYFVKQKGVRQYYILLRCCFIDKEEANSIRQSFPSEIKKLQPFRVPLNKVLPFIMPDQK